MPSTLNRIGTIFTQSRPANAELEDEQERVSPAVTLPPYSFTMEPFGAATGSTPGRSQGVAGADLGDATLVGQIQGLHHTLDRSRWPINPEYRRSPSSALAIPEPTPPGPPASESSNPASTPNPTAESSTTQQDSYIRSTTLQRSKLISDALEAGEEIYALQAKTLYKPSGEKHELNNQARLQSVFLGDLVLKTIRYIRSARKSYTISDAAEKKRLDQALQHSLKLQAKQFTLSHYWTRMVNIVEELQALLSKHHLELGIEELVTNISEVENRLALKHITQ